MGTLHKTCTKWNFKPFFKPKLNPNIFPLNRAPASLPDLQPQGVELEPEVERVDDVKVTHAVEGLPEGHEHAHCAEEDEEAVMECVEHLAAGEDGP